MEAVKINMPQEWLSNECFSGLLRRTRVTTTTLLRRQQLRLASCIKVSPYDRQSIAVTVQKAPDTRSIPGARTSIITSTNMSPSMYFVLLATACTALTMPVKVPLARRGNLPTPVSVATAKSYLAQITVASEVNSPAYDRDLFNAWITISGSCNTREYVLRRDGSGVTTGSDCTAESGSWYSDYDGETWNAASDVDNDHVVPLKEAWVSGARSWTAAQREDFANEYVSCVKDLNGC